MWVVIFDFRALWSESADDSDVRVVGRCDVYQFDIVGAGMRNNMIGLATPRIILINFKVRVLIYVYDAIPRSD